jgi:hypothetical protein
MLKRSLQALKPLKSIKPIKSSSFLNGLNSQQLAVVNEIFQSRLADRRLQLLTEKQANEEHLRASLSLLDLNSFLQSTIAFNSAQRQSHLSGLSTMLQQTLDAVRDGLSDLHGEIQASQGSSTSTRQQRLEGELQRREGALGVSLGEFRTKCEAVKLRAIYAFTMGIAALFLAIVIESSRKRRDRAFKAEKERIKDKELL